MKIHTRYSATFLLIIISISFLVSCSPAEYENVTAGENEDTAILIRGDSTYLFYGFVASDELTGPQMLLLMEIKAIRYIR